VLVRPWQSWQNAKSVALLIVLALAIGVGSAAAIYTVANGLLWKAIPYAHGERFVSVLAANTEDPNTMSAMNIRDAAEYKQKTRSFDLFGWFAFTNYNLTAPGEPRHLKGVEVTPDLVNGLGVNPQYGRWFHDATESAAILSHDLWVRLGADPAMVGKSITLDRRVYTISGIMPAGFAFPLASPYGEGQMDVWLPLDPNGKGQNQTAGVIFGLARIRPGVTLAQATAEVKQVAAGIAARTSQPIYTARVDDLHELITKELRPMVLLLMAASGLLLLITCANVSGLLVARSVARSRETAVRVALGAGLRQLAAQYFFENFFIAMIGAAGALLLAVALVRILVAFTEHQSARVNDIVVDWRTLAFGFGAAIATAVIASLGPLWQAARVPPNDVLSDGVRASAGSRSRRLSRSLVVSEIALAFVLLSMSTLLVGELYRLMHISPGFDPEHLLTFTITIPQDGAPGKPNRAAYQNSLIDSVRAVPGVTGAGITNQVPLAGCCFGTVILPDGAVPNPQSPDSVNFLPVSPGYFETMKIPLRRWRLLDSRDTGEKPLMAVIDETTARRYWPGRDPVGLTGHFNPPNGDPFQVVGIVGDVKNAGLDNETVPEMYLPAAVVPINPIKFVVRSPLPLRTIVPEITRAIRRVNPQQPIDNVRAVTDIVRDSVALKQDASYVMAFFAFAALVMATLGAYGVVSYSVRQRTVELGTRMALGAVPRDLLRLIVGGGMRMAGWGILIGGLVSIAAIELIVRNFEIRTGNGGVERLVHPGALPFLISTVIVAAVSLGSSFFPAWWATLLSPMVAMRDDVRAWSPVRVVAPEDATMAIDGSLAVELIEASRRAGSYREALAAALDAVRARLGAESAILLESTAGSDFRATVSVPESGAALIIPRDGLLANRLASYGAALPISPEDLDTWTRWGKHSTETETIANSRARLALALRTNKEMPGILLLGAGAYKPAEKRMLSGCADHFALLLENARLTDRVLEQEKLRRDVALAAEVQRRLLARQSLKNETIELAAVSIPARSVGGDYYDLLELGNDRTGIALADVAGKGVPAALIMSVVQATLRVLSAEPAISLSDLVAKMNHFLYRSTGSSSYATFFYAQFDQRDRKLRYVNAGHNPPYVLHISGAAMDELSVGGTVIGMFPVARYEEGAVDLSPGDLLVIFTDGVPEAQNPAEEEFGEERLKTVLREVASLPIEEMASRLSQELKNFIQDAAQYDDLTFVLMKVK